MPAGLFGTHLSVLGQYMCNSANRAGGTAADWEDTILWETVWRHKHSLNRHSKRHRESYKEGDGIWVLSGRSGALGVLEASPQVWRGLRSLGQEPLTEQLQYRRDGRLSQYVVAWNGRDTSQTIDRKDRPRSRRRADRSHG